MKLSKYNYYLENKIEKDLMIYNTRTGAVILIEDIDDKSRDLIKCNQVGTLDIDLKDFLMEKEILVGDEVDELADVKELYNLYVNDQNVLSLTILPTEACNFTCPYCFLYDKTNTTMGDEDYDMLYDYISDFMSQRENERDKRLIINWFGGEPTLCASKIVEFMNRIQTFVKDNKIRLYSTITTNGYLMDGEMFGKFLESGITDFQVTIDGEKENHDKSRYLRTGEGTYDVILKNLVQIRSLNTEIDYQFKIRGNFTKNSISQMYNFVKIYKEQIYDGKHFTLYFRPVYEYETRKSEIEDIKQDIYSIDEGILEQDKLMRYVAEKTGQTIERRLVEKMPGPTFGWCNAEMKNHMIVGKGGKLYLCDTLVGYKSIGKLTKEEKIKLDDITTEYNIFEDERTAKCINCRNLPLCFGGCKRNRMEQEAQCFWNEKSIYELMKNNYYEKKGGKTYEVYCY